ncbi:hypothetical protein EDB86DRAFT_2831365 [Lactarius hatsudake]|nr:hypothetical protein EDB86DRAFT_2831365 [Lactarius hatsudake]
MTPLAPNPRFRAKGAWARERGRGKGKSPHLPPLPSFTSKQDVNGDRAGRDPPFAPPPPFCARTGPHGMWGQRGRAWPRIPCGSPFARKWGERLPPPTCPPVPSFIARKRESTRGSPPPCTRLRERGTTREAPLSAARPRFGAKEARESGVAPPLPAQERRAKTGRGTGKGVRKWPHALLRARLCTERRAGAAHKLCGGALRDWEGVRPRGNGGGSRANGRGWAACNRGSGVGVPSSSPGLRAGGAQMRGGAGLGRGAPPFTHLRAPPFVLSGGRAQTRATLPSLPRRGNT